MARASKKVIAPKVRTKKPRKPYPTRDERIAIVEKKIEQLTALNKDREALIAKIDILQNKRKAALIKSCEALQRALARKESLTTGKKMVSGKKVKVNQLLAALGAKGKSLDDVLEMLDKDTTAE